MCMSDPSHGEASKDRRPEQTPFPQATRRVFVLAGLSTLLAGCGETTTRLVRDLPEPTWDSPSWRDFQERDFRTPQRRPEPRRRSSHRAYLPSDVIGRRQWSHGEPVPALMDRMQPVRYITVHHDGMDAFHATDERSSASRLETIRRAHRSYNWGDIGYHFAIDRSGRVWQARPLRWQGAHVKHYNEGNVGVLCMGNFEIQQPSRAQVAALEQFLQQLMQQYGVSVNRVRTHQEWAPTLCPGRNMQARVEGLRRSGALT